MKQNLHIINIPEWFIGRFKFVNCSPRPLPKWDPALQFLFQKFAILCIWFSYFHVSSQYRKGPGFWLKSAYSRFACLLFLYSHCRNTARITTSCLNLPLVTWFHFKIYFARHSCFSPGWQRMVLSFSTFTHGNRQ